MTAIITIVMVLAGVAMSTFALHLIARVKLIEWAAENRFFTSPALGRIKAQVRAGRIIRYIANLKGLGVHVDEETGKVLDGEDTASSWLLRRYGVRFIGLDSVHEYDIDVVEVDKEGRDKTTTVKAHSLHYTGTYSIVVRGEESLEGAPLGLHIRLTLKTVHAGHCLKFKNNWISVVHSAVKAATRDFVGKNKVRDLLKMQNECPETKDGFIELIKSLNTNLKGNPGLEETLGQQIVSVNLESIEVEDRTIVDALIAEETAVERGKATVATAKAENEKKVLDAAGNAEKIRLEAEAALFKKRQEAEGRKAEGLAENEILRDRASALGGADGLIQMKKWEAVSGLKDLQGTLVINDKDGQTPSIIVPASNFRKGG